MMESDPPNGSDPGRIFDVAISSDGKYLAAASTLDNQSVIRVWSYDVDDKLPADIKAIQAKRVAGLTPEEKKKLESYVTEQPAVIATWNVPNAAVYAIAFDATGNLAASGSDGILRVWKCSDASSITEFDVTPQRSSSTGNTVQLAELAPKTTAKH